MYFFEFTAEITTDPEGDYLSEGLLRFVQKRFDSIAQSWDLYLEFGQFENWDEARECVTPGGFVVIRRTLNHLKNAHFLLEICEATAQLLANIFQSQIQTDWNCRIVNS